ncbi:conserved hypothetical protein [Leishmania major strain Friedlin]|uniref:Uncharacterized protein n=1 Tax=Leishmania major TaxID=5664 RepID=Q4Q3R8_LEIMA|nr:conserved hypothetical protein [Leishmania major strain Friedlin]CAG9580923.1 hypothetical_protein_-_conserved [Leishmania major strain Friedlin]CAJ06742.1 conserved hypothetical protein [Leishmania major strain Friedlin]|eukprot:XP_001686030.1 conserved hypothetical protein [Leishmania major strain Friedlin]
MSTYEWVIEQESPDGVTTRVVFDFADGNTDSHGNGGRANISSSSYLLQHRRDRRGRGLSGGTPSAAGFFAFKEVACSEEGSSRRSSKHSNGSRSRRRRQHHRGTFGKGGRESGISTMAGPAGSAYTSMSLRQRYQRMLFGGGRGGRASTVAGVSRTPTVTPDASASVLASGLALSYRNDPSAGLNSDTHSLSSSLFRGTTAGGQPPSTLFMSAYGAEMVEEDASQGCSGCLSRRNRCSTRRGNSSHDGGVSSVARASAACDRNAAAPQHAAGGMRTAGDTPQHFSVLTAAATTAAATPPSSGHHRRVVAREESDDDDIMSDTGKVNGDGSYSVLRDVWATRATCPRTIATARAADFPAFPPLHSISVEKEEEPTDTVTECCGHPAGGIDARDVLSGIADAKATRRVPVSLAASEENIRLQAKVDAAEDHRRYNKMLLKKERQRRRDQGWQSTGSSGNCTVSFCRTHGSYAGESSRGLRDGASAGTSRRGCRERAVCERGRLDAYQPRSSSSTDSDEDDADDESCDTSSLSSLECLSTSSRDDFDVRELRADSVFAATVQSLASRAERERKKMEAREEQMLWSEAAQNKATSMTQRSPLHSPATLRGLMSSADGAATTTPALPPSLATVPRRAEAASTGLLIRNGVGSGNAGRSGAVSSFFISPIHQSVAAESAAWTAGTGFEFLGQGGLGGNDTASSSLLPTSRPAPWQRRGSAFTPARATMSRRRERSEDNEEGYAEELKESCDAGASSSTTHAMAADAQTSTHRARKKRKRGDRARQSVVGECGGSRALRPVAAPSNGPPLEILPCSKMDMREDLLESFLMEAVLDEDDFALY